MLGESLAKTARTHDGDREFGLRDSTRPEERPETSWFTPVDRLAAPPDRRLVLAAELALTDLGLDR